LDMAGVDGRKPQDDYQQLLDELKLYNPEILKKKRLVVANKMDLPDAKKNLAALKRKLVGRASRPSKKKQAGETPTPLKRIIEISALAGEGLEKLKLELHKALA